MAAQTPSSQPDDDTPFVSQHAATQWDRRTTHGSVSPETGWQDAHEMTIPRDYQHDDALRYYPPEGVVLAQQQNCIATILKAGVDPVLVDAIESQFGNTPHGGGGQ